MQWNEQVAFMSTAREAAQRAQTRMMPSASIAGWLATATILGVGVLGDGVRLTIVGALLILVMIAWEWRNYRARHRWGRLMQRAEDEGADTPDRRRRR